MRSALLEIEWQNWILALAHDPWSAHLGREVRRLLANLGWPVISTRYLSPEPGDDRADPTLAALGHVVDRVIRDV